MICKYERELRTRTCLRPQVCRFATSAVGVLCLNVCAMRGPKRPRSPLSRPRGPIGDLFSASATRFLFQILSSRPSAWIQSVVGAGLHLSTCNGGRESNKGIRLFGTQPLWGSFQASTVSDLYYSYRIYPYVVVYISFPSLSVLRHAS